MMNLEDKMSVDELRREVRWCWDKAYELEDSFRDLPEVPPYSVLISLSSGLDPFWSIGKNEQFRLPYGVVPSKCECEVGMGRWAVIRDALRAVVNPPRKMIAGDITEPGQ